MAGVGVGGGSGVAERGKRVPSGCRRPGLPGPTPGWLLLPPPPPPRLLRDGDLGRGRVRAPAAGGGAAAVAARPPGADSFASGKDAAVAGGGRGARGAGGVGAPAQSLSGGAGKSGTVRPGAGPSEGRGRSAPPWLPSPAQGPGVFWGGVTGLAPSWP